MPHKGSGRERGSKEWTVAIDRKPSLFRSMVDSQRFNQSLLLLLSLIFLSSTLFMSLETR